MQQEDILQEIVAVKKREVNARKQKLPEEFLREQLGRLSAPRQFLNQLKKELLNNNIAIIAEIKKASPREGLKGNGFSPKNLAKVYEENGATCISVLTETHYFLGRDDHLKEAKQYCCLPLLRKDFIIDEYQIYESAFMGADCILLFAPLLDDEQLLNFYTLAQRLHLDVLIEVDDREQLPRVLTIDPELIVISNRNLKTFQVDLQTSINLASEIPHGKIMICDGGIQNRADIELLMQHGIQIFIVGEALLKTRDPGKKLYELLAK